MKNNYHTADNNNDEIDFEKLPDGTSIGDDLEAFPAKITSITFENEPKNKVVDPLDHTKSCQYDEQHFYMKEIDKMRGDLDQLKNVESTMIKTRSRD